MTFAIAAFLRPFAALLVLWLICWPIKKAAQKYLPEGRLKRFLFISWKV